MPFAGAGFTASVQATQWLVENQPVKVQVWGRWPWFGVQGNLLTYARVGQLVPASVVAACAALRQNDDSATQVQYGMVEYATRFQYCNADEDINRDPNLLGQMLTELGKIKLGYGYCSRMDTATGVPATGGLPDLVAPGNVLNLGGAALSFPCLEQAFDLVTANSGRPTVIMSNSASMRSYRNLCWAAGIEPPQMPWQWIDKKAQETRMSKEDFVRQHERVEWEGLKVHHSIAQKCVAAGHWDKSIDKWASAVEPGGAFEDFEDYLKFQRAASHTKVYEEWWDKNAKK